MSVLEEVRAAAKILLHPPPAPVTPLKDAIRSPLKQRVSISVKIIQEDQQQQVMVKNEPVTINAIYVRDETMSKVKVTLWRETAVTVIRPADFCTITDLVTNTFRNETPLNSTSNINIEKKDMPTETSTITVVGVSVEDNKVVLLDKSGNMFSILETLVKTIIPDEIDVESFFTTSEKTVKIEKQGDEIISIALS